MANEDQFHAAVINSTGGDVARARQAPKRQTPPALTGGANLHAVEAPQLFLALPGSLQPPEMPEAWLQMITLTGFSGVTVYSIM